MGKAAAGIISMPWDTPGVIWETETLAREALGKCIFVMPPCYEPMQCVRSAGPLLMPWFERIPRSDAARFAERWRTAVQPLRTLGLAVPDYNWNGLILVLPRGASHLKCLRIPAQPREFMALLERISALHHCRKLSRKAGVKFPSAGP